jgi:hypothetical protein
MKQIYKELLVATLLAVIWGTFIGYVATPVWLVVVISLLVGWFSVDIVAWLWPPT